MHGKSFFFFFFWLNTKNPLGFDLFISFAPLGFHFYYRGTYSFYKDKNGTSVKILSKT
jgi:hypothetical protein